MALFVFLFAQIASGGLAESNSNFACLPDSAAATDSHLISQTLAADDRS
jgi:hypothetical protein